MIGLVISRYGESTTISGTGICRSSHPCWMCRVSASSTLTVTAASVSGRVPWAYPHARRVGSWDQPGRGGLQRGDQQDRERGEEYDPVAERRPVAAGVQLAGQVPVLGEDRAEHGEAVERGVGGQHEDQRGGRDDQEEGRPEAAEHGGGEPWRDRLLGGPRRQR